MRPVTYANSRAQELFCMSNQHGSGGAALIADEYFGQTGIVAAAVLYIIASGKAGFDLAAGFASNGYAAHSPGGHSLMACLVAEVVLTLVFLFIILGATDKRAPQGFAPIAIGLGLTLI